MKKTIVVTVTIEIETTNETLIKELEDGTHVFPSGQIDRDVDIAIDELTDEYVGTHVDYTVE